MTTPDPDTTLIHLECPARGEFLELREHDNHLRIRTGAIGRPCLVLPATFTTAGKAQDIQQRLLARWQEKGFVECTPSVPIVEGCVADELFCNARDPHPLLKPFFRITGAEDLRSQPRRLALFRSGLRWHEDFDLERIGEFGVYSGVIFDGDVEIDGVFSQLTYTYPGYILVAGDIRAASFGHGDSHMRVLGDVRVRNIIYGEYNDGSLQIDGAAHGRAFISSDHSMYAAAGCHMPVCDWDMDENWSDYLHPELFEYDPDCDGPGKILSHAAIRAFMREGRDPFRPGAQPVMEQMPEPQPAPPEAAPPSAFAQRLRDCVNTGDVEAITQLIETWPQRDEEWRQSLIGRLCAPSTTPEQRVRLQALLD